MRNRVADTERLIKVIIYVRKNAGLSQMDLAATLLAQLHIPYDDFTFSKNLTDSTKEHFVFYAFPDGFGFVDKDGAAVYDCASQSILIGQNDSNAIHLNKGKAYLQKLYDDLARR